MGITWQDKATNTAVLERAGSLSIHPVLCQCRLCWLGHVQRMDDGRIPKDLLYGELATGNHLVGRPALRFKHICKCDMKLTDIDPSSWEALAANPKGWHHTIHNSVRLGEEKRTLQLKEKRLQRKEGQKNVNANQQSDFARSNCSRDCRARIGLLSHSRCCSQQK